MALTIDDVAHLPELEFEKTRQVGTPVEVARIAPLRVDPELVRFEPETLVLGLYRDAASGNDYLVHSHSLRPDGGFPEVSKLGEIHQYEKVRDYSS